jgi:hypothetical protein
MADTFRHLLLAMEQRLLGGHEAVGLQLVVGAWLYSALALCFSLYAAAPYGKFTDSAETPAPVRSFLGCKMSSRLGWFIQGF